MTLNIVWYMHFVHTTYHKKDYNAKYNFDSLIVQSHWHLQSASICRLQAAAGSAAAGLSVSLSPSVMRQLTSKQLWGYQRICLRLTKYCQDASPASPVALTPMKGWVTLRLNITFNNYVCLLYTSPSPRD